jgi:type II secretory pathway component PulM
MTALWVVTVTALVVAVAAWLAARRATRRLAQLSEMYWELKYQHSELKNALSRGAAHQAPAADPTGSPAPAQPARPTDSFVPLQSLRR